MYCKCTNVINIVIDIDIVSCRQNIRIALFPSLFNHRFPKSILFRLLKLTWLPTMTKIFLNVMDVPKHSRSKVTAVVMKRSLGICLQQGFLINWCQFSMTDLNCILVRHVVVKLNPVYKRSVQRHINYGCSSYKKRKDMERKNKVCNFCGMEFTKKSNRDRHVRSKHTGDVDQPLLSFCEVSHDQPDESNPDFEHSDQEM